MPPRHTVYLLGAGFSADAKLPVLGNLLEELLDFECSAIEPLRGAQRRVKGKLGQVEGAAWFKLPPEEQHNLESLFSVFEYLELEDNTHGNLFHDVRRLLHVFLRRRADLGFRIAPNAPYGYIADGSAKTPYHQFVEGRLSGKDPNEVSAVITTNYDLVLEKAMWGLGITPDYRMLGASGWRDLAGPGTALLKLHGSLNWHRQADDLIAVRGGESLECPSDDPGHDDWVMLPPTTQKNVFSVPGISAVWVEALALLQQLDRLVVVGYSLPATDPYFRQFLTAGLSKNDKAFEVETYLHSDDEARARFQSFFLGGGLSSDRLEQHTMGFFDGLSSGRL